jgi:predicted dithiol-disulfide oxidoreductase (DUF899 family)
MSLPDIVDRQTWRAARIALLAKEKEMTRQIDALNTQRRMLPMVPVDKAYRFAGPDGEAGLADLFGEMTQLIVQHVMFDPEWDGACSSCTASVDEVSDGVLRHLASRDTAFALVSRAPLAKLAKYRAERGWTIPWYSSNGSDFNYDYHVTFDEAVTEVEYNYRSAADFAAAKGWSMVEPGTSSEQPGLSCFLKVADEIFHTYSAYARGTDHLGGSYALLDLTALGRQEKWEEPKGRAAQARKAVPDFSE